MARTTSDNGWWRMGVLVDDNFEMGDSVGGEGVEVGGGGISA